MQAEIPRVCSIVFIKHSLAIVSLAIVSVAIALLMTLRTATVNTEECDSTFILLTANFKIVILINQNYDLKCLNSPFTNMREKEF